MRLSKMIGDRYREFGAVAVALLLSSCGGPSDARDLAGLYKSEFNSGTAVLRLEGSGKFEETIILERLPKPVQQRGTWRYDPKLSQVLLFNLIHPDDLNHYDGKQSVHALAGIASLPVEYEYLIGPLQIGSDEGTNFIQTR